MPVVQFTERQIHGVMLLVLVLIVTAIGAVVIGQLLRTWRRYTQRHAPSQEDASAAPDAWTVAGQRMSAPTADEMDDDEEEDEDDLGPDDFHDFDDDDDDEEDPDDDGEDDEEKDKPRKA